MIGFSRIVRNPKWKEMQNMRIETNVGLTLLALTLSANAQCREAL
jgi:hypothetical protein